jgi:hypothetical protein
MDNKEDFEKLPKSDNIRIEVDLDDFSMSRRAATNLPVTRVSYMPTGISRFNATYA